MAALQVLPTQTKESVATAPKLEALGDSCSPSFVTMLEACAVNVTLPQKVLREPGVHERRTSGSGNQCSSKSGRSTR